MSDTSILVGKASFIEELGNLFRQFKKEPVIENDEFIEDIINYAAEVRVHNEYHFCVTDSFALWFCVNPVFYTPGHALKLNNVTIYLSSAQVALLRALLVGYNEIQATEHNPPAERKKMTAKLRFQMLARDNYTCQLCGASPDPNEDNKVTLHVDHILPISKGGKTHPNNLTTLCQTCNSGKSNDVYPGLFRPEYFTPPEEAYYRAGPADRRKNGFIPIFFDNLSPVEPPQEKTPSFWNRIKEVFKRPDDITTTPEPDKAKAGN
jgi:hypothetical protein